MLYHSIRYPESSVYRGQCTATLSGPMEDRPFMDAWNLAALRHQAFRTFFAWERRDQPVQVVRQHVELTWTVLDWVPEAEYEQERRWQQLLDSDRNRAFELTNAPIMRFVLVHLGPNRHRVLWSLHHALADGWSGTLVLREVLADYAALNQGSQPTRPTPPSFATFITWLRSRDEAAAEAYWRQKLAGFDAPTPLPGVSHRRSSNGRATIESALDEGVTPALQAAAVRMRVTPNTIGVGAWALVLSRYAPEASEVTFGVTISERPPEIPGVDRSVGLYLNTVPVRVAVRPGDSARDWLVGLQHTLSEGRDQSAGGLADIQRWSALESRADLARSVVVYESFPEAVSATEGKADLLIEATTISAPSDLPLALLIYPDDRLTLQLVYDTALYDETTAARLLDEVTRTLQALIDSVDGAIDDVDVVGPETRQTLLESWSGGETTVPPEPPDVLELFEGWADRTPAAIAIRTHDGKLTYEELDRAADRLAARILGDGLEPGSLLGIAAERTTETVIAILAALKAGFGYTLIDPDQPGPRLTAMVDHVDRVLPGSDPGRTWERPLRIDPSSEPRQDRPGATFSAGSTAYVVWTSGSTGTPKGVVVERGQLAHSMAARLMTYDRTPARFLLLSSFAVDSAAAGFFWTLCTGGCLILPETGAEQDLAGLAGLIEKEEVETTLLMPALYRTLLEEVDPERLRSLRTVIVAGDACPSTLVDLHRIRLSPVDLSPVDLFNEYGPSECTVWATVANLTHEPDGPVTIGRPVPGVRLYLLDPDSRVVPIGSAGEICLGGSQVARGYLKQDELTVSRFVDDPFQEGGRMYRTGDRARFLGDGRVQFLGRLDDQIKVRGFRVEPAEIERVLESNRDIEEAAVVMRTRVHSTDVDALVRRLEERAGIDANDLLTEMLEIP
jgi:amino acid adenylation domain-containing protein